MAVDVIGRDDEARLLVKIQAELPSLRELLAQSSDQWGYEDPIYRFYHHSFKVFRLQDQTERIVSALRELLPIRPLNSSFLEIVDQGTGNAFSAELNAEWPTHTRPILEAYFHARFFLEMAVRYAEQPEPPTPLPSGWAALLCSTASGDRSGGLCNLNEESFVPFASRIVSAK